MLQLASVLSCHYSFLYTAPKTQGCTSSPQYNTQPANKGIYPVRKQTTVNQFHLMMITGELESHKQAPSPSKKQKWGIVLQVLVTDHCALFLPPLCFPLALLFASVLDTTSQHETAPIAHSGRTGSQPPGWCVHMCRCNKVNSISEHSHGAAWMRYQERGC